MEINSLKSKLSKYENFEFHRFYEKKSLKIITKKDFELQKVYIYPIYPRDSEIYSDKRFVSIDNGSMGGTHWCCFIVKINQSYQFDSFGGRPDKLLLSQLTKPIPYHNYKIQDINSRLCGTYCLHFFYLIEGMNYYDDFFKKCFESHV